MQRNVKSNFHEAEKSVAVANNLCSQIFPAVIGHSWDLDQRRNGT